MRLWQKKDKIDREILDFCTGDDYIIDNNLIKYDVQASIAHAEMLRKIGIVNNEELQKLKRCFKAIQRNDALGKFKIKKAES